MNTNAYSLPLLIQSARHVFEQTVKLIQERNPSDIRTTAIFTVTDKVLLGLPPIIVLTLGEVIYDSESMNKWDVNSREKAARICKSKSDISAWQSRDFDNKKYGGAIMTPTGKILSMSGLPEFGDEACCLVIALEMLWIDEKTAKKIVEISQNDLFHDLYERWKKI